FVAGRISIARTQGGSVTPDGVERLSHAFAWAGIVNDGERTIRSGGPPNSFAKFHSEASGHSIAAGMSFGSPCGAPASAADRTRKTVAPRRRRAKTERGTEDDARTGLTTSDLRLPTVGVGRLVGVVRAADQRARLDVHEAHPQGDAFQLREFIGVVVADHRRVRGGRPEVLADRQDAAVHPPQISEGRDQLVVLFAEADHDAGLDRNVRRMAA